MAAARAAAWKRWLQSKGVRRAAVIAGKAAAGTAAAGGGLVLGLREVKRTLKAEEALDVWSEASFDLSARAGAGARARQRALLAKLHEGGELARGEFEAAARRLFPVELQLEESASGSDHQQGLVTRWREAGFFDKTHSASRQAIFGRRLTSDAQGVDIGVLVPPYLSPPEADEVAVQPAEWTASREPAAAALERWGCALLRGAVAPEDVARLRVALGLGKGADSRRASEVGQWLQQRDPNVAMGRYTFGRLHCLLRGSPEFEPQAVAVHAAVAPLVHAFFRDAVSQGAQVFLSEAQMIVADPMADAQAWHMDSGAPSLSVFVPLSRVGGDHGQQMLLPGSHKLHDASLPRSERWKRCLRAVFDTHGAQQAAQPAAVHSAAAAEGEQFWEAGDALVLDSRLLHRGLANESLGKPVVVLVLRYDLTASPPPGCSRRYLLAMTRVGDALHALGRLFAVL